MDLTSFMKLIGGDEVWLRKYSKAQYRRIDRDAKYVMSLKPNKIANIGAAPFLLEYLLSKHHCFEGELVSLDIAPQRFDRIVKELKIDAKQIDIETSESEDLAVAIAGSDVVVLCEVFEHLRHDLLGTMRSIFDAMPENGQLYMTTPNGLGFRQMVRQLRGYSGPPPVSNWKKLHDIGHMGHVREYSKRELIEVLNFVGFKDVKIEKLPHWSPMISINLEHTIIRCAETVWPWKQWCLRVTAKKLAQSL